MLGIDKRLIVKSTSRWLAAGIGVGVLGRVAHVPSLQTVAPDLARRLAWVALLGFGIFLLLSLGLVWHSGLMLLEGA